MFSSCFGLIDKGNKQQWVVSCYISPWWPFLYKMLFQTTKLPLLSIINFRRWTMKTSLTLFINFIRYNALLILYLITSPDHLTLLFQQAMTISGHYIKAGLVMTHFKIKWSDKHQTFSRSTISFFSWTLIYIWTH